MADRTDKVENNVPGKYSVDFHCIDCDVLRETAPNNFEADEDEGYFYVFSQPKDTEEVAQCQQAVESCPVEAIGDDGDESDCALLNLHISPVFVTRATRRRGQAGFLASGRGLYFAVR